jgi:hypothetical protein
LFLPFRAGARPGRPTSLTSDYEVRDCGRCSGDRRCRRYLYAE